MQLGFLRWDPAFFQMQHPSLISRAIQLGRCLCRAPVRWSLVSRVPKFAHATVLNTARNNMGRHAKATQCLVKDVPPASGGIVHAICRFSSIWQQCMEEELRLVAIDKQHHGSHHKTVLEERLSRDHCEKDPNFCWLPSGNSSEIRVFWNQVKRSVDTHSASPGNLSMPGLCLEEIALFIRLDGEHPLSGHIVL